MSGTRGGGHGQDNQGLPQSDESDARTGGADSESARWARLVRSVPIVAEMGDDLPCYTYPPGEPERIGETVTAYRLAQAKADLLCAALIEAGFMCADFPGLAASVDCYGRPMVVLGPVSVATVVRLAQLAAHLERPDGGRAA